MTVHVPGPGALTLAAALILWVIASGSSCAARAPRADYGIPVCPVAAADALLSPDALQRFFAESRPGHGYDRQVTQALDELVRRGEATLRS